MFRFVFTLAVVLSFSFNAFAGGCNPGEPCYEEPIQAQAAPPIPREPVKMYEPPIIEPEPVVMLQKKKYYATVGAGFSFLEKDEEVLGQQIYDIRFGLFRFLPRLSAELAFAYHPDVRNREFPDRGRFRVTGDTSAISATASVLYHLFDEKENRFFDSYLAFGGGFVHYNKKLKHGSTDPYLEAGAGTFINIAENVFVKPDYRVAVVGNEDTEVNQRATISLGVRFK